MVEAGVILLLLPLSKISLALDQYTKVPYFGVTCLFFFSGYVGDMWDLNSLTRDQSHSHCSGSMESYPLDPQGSPMGSHILNPTSMTENEMVGWHH